ncbi:hypothetical protein [Candidatus Nitrosocosmicus sp. T]
MIVVEYANAQSPISNSIDISGIYISDKQALYHIIQTNNTVWILGTTTPDNASGIIKNIFSGVLDDNFSRITGKWIDSPLSNNMQSGNVNFELLIDSSKKNITMNQISQVTESDRVYPVNMLTKYDPAVHGPLTIYISMENVLIDIPRSPVSDLLYIGISGQKNNDTPLAATKYLGPRGYGSNITTDLRIGPFSINNENDTLKVYILGLDKEDGSPSFTLVSLRNTLIELMEPSYNVTSLVQGTHIISSISPALIPRGCNGLVFIDMLELSSESLRNLTAFNGENNQENTYSGTTSPPGCGPPSQYVVKLSIKNHG